MDLSLTEEQQMLKKSARDFLAANCPPKFVKSMEADARGYTLEVWKKMADLGWLGIAIPEEYGGSGGSPIDLGVLLEEMGYAAQLGPFFASSVMGVLSLLEAGSEEQKQRLLPQVARGNLILTLALAESEGYRYSGALSTAAGTRGEGYVLTGLKTFVPDAHVADYVVCPAAPVSGRRGASTLFLVDTRAPGFTASVLDTIAKDKPCEVALNAVPVPRQDVLGKVGEGRRYLETLLPKLLAAKSLDMLGGCQRILDMTVDYTKRRIQFGRATGSFQAVQHYCANMGIEIDGARILAYRTAWMMSEGMAADDMAFMAKSWVSDVYRRAAAIGVQLHGGAGVITEGDMQIFFRRAKACESVLADADYCRERVAQGLKL